MDFQRFQAIWSTATGITLVHRTWAWLTLAGTSGPPAEAGPPPAPCPGPRPGGCWSPLTFFATRAHSWLMQVSKTTGSPKRGSTDLVCTGSGRNNCVYLKSWQHFSCEDILWLTFHIIGNKPCHRTWLQRTGTSGVLNHPLCQIYVLFSHLVLVHKDGIRIRRYICKWKLYLNTQRYFCEIISPVVAFKIFWVLLEIF